MQSADVESPPPQGCLQSSSLWGLVAPLLIFNSPKAVVLRDIRLGILLRLMQVVIVVFILWNILYKQTFLYNEVPLGIVEPVATGRNISVTTGPDLFKAYEDSFWANATAPGIAGRYQYCLNSSYDFRVSETLDYNNISCVYRDKAELSSRSSGSIFVTTFFENKRVDAVAAPNATACATLLPCAVNMTSYRLGRCYCSSDRYFFTVGAEELIISFNHIFYTTKKEGALPRTRIRRHESDNDLAVIPASKSVSFSLRQWLAFAGVDLDKSTNQTNSTLTKTGYGYSTGRQPTVRLSGVQLVMKLQYYNYNQWPGAKRKAINAGAPTECILVIEPKFLGSSTGNLVNYVNNPGFGYPDASSPREQFSYINDIGYGVLFNFQAAGIHGRFDYNRLIQALLGGAVLLKVAQVIVTYVAIYGLGLRSQLYKEHLKETVVFEKEYARFAAHAMAAMRVFKMLDVNGNGKLDKDDIFHQLRQIDDRPSDAQVRLLVDFMLKQSDALTDIYTTPEGKEIKKGDGKLSLEEYIEMFTDDKTSMNDLLKMTQQLKATEEEKKQRAAERKEKQAKKASRRRKSKKQYDSDGSEVVSDPGSPARGASSPDGGAVSTREAAALNASNPKKDS